MNMPFIIAEISGNHLGSLANAKALIRAAALAEADAVKLQLFEPSRMVGDPTYVIPSGPWAGRKLIDLYREAMTPREWFPELFALAHDLGIEVFSSVFDEAGIDYLETLNCPRYKISSFELTDLELIHKAASTGKPLILSTGMATGTETTAAIYAACEARNPHLTLLLCVSAYPADATDINLAALDEWRNFGSFDAIGLSDHTLGNGVACAAVAMGATMIEKHLCLDRALGGPDAAFSLDPEEFSTLVKEVRRAAAASDRVWRDGPVAAEKPSLDLRRSLYFAHDLPASHILTPEDIRCARPALGLHPHERDKLPGSILKRAVHAGEPVTWEMLA